MWTLFDPQPESFFSYLGADLCGHKYDAALIAACGPKYVQYGYIGIYLGYKSTFNYKFLWYQINALSASVKTI